MAARGLVEDQIALRLGSDKNQLRRRYIDAVKAGRAAKREAQAAELTKEQQKTREVIRQTWDYWYDEELGSHLIYEGARTPEEAIEMSEACQKAKKTVSTAIRSMGCSSIGATSLCSGVRKSQLNCAIGFWTVTANSIDALTFDPEGCCRAK
jgi:hypothetical protein